jgi:hypothetical protein
MRRWLAILVVIGIVMAMFVPEAMAEPKPTMIPREVMSGDAEFVTTFGFTAFEDLWVELEGVGAELPQTGTDKFLCWEYQVEDFLRGRQRADGGIEGIPIGFTFHYMQGPPELAPGWPAYIPEGGGIEDLPSNWPAILGDRGYERVYVSTNGFLVLDDPEWQEYVYDPEAEEWHWRGAGNWNWWPWQLPIREPPNNFIAPYWTDLAIGDNSYQKVEDLCRRCILPELPIGEECPRYEWLPCEWSTVERPRGRLLYATLGEEPNRKFVVEWLNARNRHTGSLCTFQVQLFEGSSAILFLYKDFQNKDASTPYFEVPSVLIGIEDYYGATAVGTAFTSVGGGVGSMIPGMPSWRGIVMNWIPKPVFDIAPWWIFQWLVVGFHIPQPRNAGDMVGFVY